MDPSFVLFLLFRFLLPAFLTIVSVLRFNLFSLCYLLIFFVCPFLPSPKRNISSSGAKCLLVLILVLSSVFLLAQISYNITLASLKLNEMSSNCTLGNTLNQLGLYQLGNMPVHRALRILMPDVAILVVAACIFSYLRRVERHQYESLLASTMGAEIGADSGHMADHDREEPARTSIEPSRLQRQLIVTTLYNLTSAACCMLAGIMSASVLSAVYFLAFMTIATLWASIKLVERRLNMIRIFLLVYTGFHVLFYYLYQFQGLQNVLPDGSFPARLLGFYYLFQSKCDHPGELIFNSEVRWTEYVAPPVTFLLFYVLALATRRSLDRESLVSREGSPQQSSSTTCDERQVLTQEAEIEEHLISDEVTNYGTNYNHDNVAMQDHPNVALQNSEQPFLLSLLSHIIRVSYIVAFLAMMAWSVIYVSWLSFVLLLTACLIWIVPRSRLVCLYLSPIIVAYGSGLMLLQYVFAMNLDELPTVYNGVHLDTFGMKKYAQPVGVLAIQVVLMIAFWSTLRLYTTEKTFLSVARNTSTFLEATRTVTPRNLLRLDMAALFGTRENSSYTQLMYFLRQQLVKLWIVITCLLMLIISTQQPVVMFRIVYMVLFIYFMLTFMISYDFWRKQMVFFWWIVIGYSMLVLICIYTFQFESVRNAWSTILTENILADIGMSRFEGSALFTGLLTPVVFLVVVIFQVHYFHREFMSISAISERPIVQETDQQLEDAGSAMMSVVSEDFMTDMSSVMRTIADKMRQLFTKRYILWRLAEVHLDKIVTIFTAIAIINTVSALWLPLIIILSLALPFIKSPSHWNTVIFCWLGLMILVKMVYQLPSLMSGVNIVPYNCSMINLTSDPKENPTPFTMKNLTSWLGLKEKEDYQGDINYLLALVCFVITHVVVNYHQIQWYTSRAVERPMHGIIFPNLDPKQVEESCLAFIKFLFNHAFYKFGLELSFIVSMIAVAVRADGLAAVYLLLTMIFILLPRDLCSRLWGTYCIVLGICIIAEYLVYLGLPVTLCTEYVWTAYFTKIGYPAWIVYLSLPDYRFKTPISFLVADFFRFMFACMQMRAFRIERSHNVMARGGDDNIPVLRDLIPKPGTRDFISMKGSFLDYMKHGIFMYFFYVSLFILFGAGLMSTNLLSLLYLISSFIFLWMGMNLYTRPRRQLVHIWNSIIAYNLIVVLVKCGLQILGCIYPSTVYMQGNAWISKLFTVKCLNTYPLSQPMPVNPSDDTDENTLASTMTWDVICFSALLIQRKIFTSELFSNIVLDIRVQQKFASRGAAIINSRLIYEVTVKKVKEAKMLARVRRKLEKIRLRRQTWGVPNFDEHYKVLRSGDAHLFEHDSDSDGDSTLFTSPGEGRNDDDDEQNESSSQIEELPCTSNETELRRRKKAKSISVDHPQTEHGQPRKSAIHPIALINRVIDSGPATALEELNSPTEPKPAKSAKSWTKSEPVSPSAEESVLDHFMEPRESQTLSLDSTFSSCDAPALKPRNRKEVDLPAVELRTESGEDYHDAVDIDVVESDEELKDGGCWQGTKAFCVIIWRLIISFLDWLIEKLNHITREYRNIRMTLEAERKLAKRKVKDEGAITALHVHGYERLTTTGSSSDDSDESDESNSSVPNAVVSVSSRTVDPKCWKREVQQQLHQVELAETEFKRHRSRFFLLTVAIGNLAGQYWEQLCYLIMVINHVYSASLLSMIYPFLIFIWGMLSVPRPSKLFWSCVIIYTMVLIVVKYMFQFPFELLDDIANLGSSGETCINLGLSRLSAGGIGSTTLDLIQLMVVFIHRGFLKANGLWRAVSDTHDEMLALAKRYGQHLGYDEVRGDVVADARRESTVQPEVPENASKENENHARNERSGEHFYEKPLINMKRFFEKMTDPLFNVRVDVYASMFFCEFIGLMTLVFGYSYFVPDEGSDENVTDYISQSKIPIPFLVMCLIQFIIIIVDRALFLQKLVVGKLIFQFIMMIAIHIWIFIALPCYTNMPFQDNAPVVIFYLLKCVYFGLSAYQIRSGYPVRVLGNFLTKSYNYVNLFLYKGFVVVPFLMDLRCVMDWVWTETTLGLYHWDQMEHIYSLIYVVKCWHYSEDMMPTPRGNRRGKCAKYGLGGLVVALIVLAIWLPMLVFSILGATAEPNVPYQCDASISISGFTPIYTATVQTGQLQSITIDKYDALKKSYEDERVRSVLNRFEAKDVAIVRMDENSSVIWSITPPGQSSLITQLNSSTPVELSLSCKRKATSVSASVNGIFRHTLNDTERQALIHTITDNRTKAKESWIHQIFPRYVIVNKDSIEHDKTLSPETDWISLGVVREQTDRVQWWRIQELVADNRSKFFDINNLEQPYIVTLNERAYQINVITSFFAGYGLIGLYVVFVIWFANLIRRILFCSDTLRFDDMPYVDRILKLCHDIYLVREHKDWELEEELYSKLDYLWRSPETMIKYSKPKSE